MLSLCPSLPAVVRFMSFSADSSCEALPAVFIRKSQLSSLCCFPVWGTNWYCYLLMSVIVYLCLPLSAVVTFMLLAIWGFYSHLSFAVVCRYLSLSSTKCICQVFLLCHCTALFAAVICFCQSLSFIFFHQVQLSKFPSLPLQGTIRRCHLLLSVVISHCRQPSRVVKFFFFAIARRSSRLSFAVVFPLSLFVFH